MAQKIQALMKKILLIDDDPIFVFLAKKILETVDKTAKIEIFPDGELAIGHIYSIKNNRALLPDIIFLDLNMPVLDGWGFLDQYAVIYSGLIKKIRLYILTSSISPEDIGHASEYPLISGYLVKPINKEKMAEIVSRH
jgi:CheY-like chemotaxis protein